MTKDIQQANVCGIAFCPSGRNYFLIGTKTNPMQTNPILGSMWLAVSTIDFLFVDDDLNTYKHPCIVWLPIGTVIEFRNHLPINIEGE